MEPARQRPPGAAPSSKTNEDRCEVLTFQVLEDELIRMTIAEDLAFGELVRDGMVVASARFANQDALRRWAGAILERAARNSSRAAPRLTGCINCDH
jgi:hypothetical protein